MGVLLFGSILFLLYALQSVRQDPSQPSADAADEGAEMAALAQPVPRAAPAGVTYDRYEELAKRSVFAPRRAAPPTTKVRKPRDDEDGGLPPLNRETTPPKLDLTGWSYVGYVMFDDVKVGIVQHESSSTVEFLEVGGQLMGAEVTEITGGPDGRIRFKSGTRTTMLSRERDFAVTPLDKAATPGSRPQRR
jgi:hypothetical protein